MPDATSPVQTFISHADLTDQHITAIEANVRRYIKEEEFWYPLFDHKPWEKGKTSASYRKLIKQSFNGANIAELAEGISPVPGKIEYATFTNTVKDYGGKFRYSDVDVRRNFDDIVSDLSYQNSDDAVSTRDYLVGSECVKATVQFTAKTTYAKTLATARIMLDKGKCKPFRNGKYLLITTPEVVEAIVDEIGDKNNITEDLKNDVYIKGVVYSLKGFYIVSRTDTFLYGADGKHAMIFMGTRGGRKPLMTYGAELEIKHKPLGSSVIKDTEGNLTSDDLDQMGSVGWKMVDFAVCHQEDPALVNCFVALDKINITDKLGAEITDLDNFASYNNITKTKSPTSKSPNAD